MQPTRADLKDQAYQDQVQTILQQKVRVDVALRDDVVRDDVVRNDVVRNDVVRDDRLRDE
jgi:hypothetical protein